jgi:hypothetical protein
MRGLAQSSDTEHQLKGYPWPASALTKADMARLTQLRDLTGEPITKLVHAAIAEYHNQIMEQTLSIQISAPETADGAGERDHS